MMHYPKISIITPSYNQAQFIEETILSVKNQDYPNIEHIVIDGGSTDGTLEILKRYNDSLTWISEPDEGQANAINKGFRMAKGEILAWLNSDDLYAPEAIRTAVETLIKFPNIDLVYGHCLEIDQHGNPIGLLKSREFSKKRLYRYPSPIPQPTAFFRRTVLEKVGYLDEQFRYSFDYDFWLRIGKVNKMKLIPQILASFRYHASSKTVAEQKKFLAEDRRIFLKHGGSRISLFYFYHLRKQLRPHLRPFLKPR